MCNYCNSDNFNYQYEDGYYGELYKNERYDIGLYLDKESRRFFITDEIGFEIEVKYCPMCGKVLSYEEDIKSNLLQERAFRAATKFLCSKGHEILCDTADDYVDVVSLFDGELHFCHIENIIAKEDIENGFNDENVDRKAFENFAIKFLSQYNGENAPVSFDIISLIQVSDAKAMLRYHSNVCGVF